MHGLCLCYVTPRASLTGPETRVLDRKTRKYLTMYRALHSRDSVARIYLPRNKGRRGLISVEDCVNQAAIGLSSYIAQSNEVLLTAARGNLHSPQEIKQAKSSEKEKRMTPRSSK